MTRPVTIITALLAAAALFAAIFAAGPAGAIVPPKDCGFLKVGGKRYNVKADQLPCRYHNGHNARAYTRTYLRYHSKPRYYKCFDYTSSAYKFKCVASRYSPDRTFWAIKR